MNLVSVWRPLRLSLMFVGLLGLCLSVSTVSLAQEPDPSADETAAEVEDTTEEAAEEEAAPLSAEDVGYALDNTLLFIAAVMVFFMQAGFAMVEAGFNAQKNAVNVLFKNAMDICVGVLLFFFVGYGLMYPGVYADPTIAPNGYFGFGGIAGIAATDGGDFSPEVGWLFQAVFAATAATIVSGAVAGRMKVGGYLIYSAVLTALVYPISGYWKWGEGWLNDMGFQDFAGSAVVHGVGGFAGLAGALVLGPRIGRFVNGKSMPMPGHSLPIAALGVFILWFGWYGFNPGSALGFKTVDGINGTMHCAITTTLAAGAGGLVATLVSWVVFSKPDLSMGLNGILGGLVGITACCDCMSNMQSIIVGAVAGVLIIAGVVLLDKLQIDDPVGAFPVHGLCGVWGCMAIGILPNGYLEDGTTSLWVQFVGTITICAWAFGTMLVLFSVLKAVGMLRVSAEEEQTGLDISEHGMHAYPADTVAKAS